MGKTLSEWNEYYEALKRLRDVFHEGTKTTKGLCAQIAMEDCDIIFDLLVSECDKVYNRELDYTCNRLSRSKE